MLAERARIGLNRLAHCRAVEAAMPTEDGPEPLLIKHAEAMRMIACGPSHYWGLVRKGKITVVEKGRAGRAYRPSVVAYVQELVAEAAGRKAA
jgi:hypothetical protein